MTVFNVTRESIGMVLTQLKSTQLNFITFDNVNMYKIENIQNS